MKSTDELLQLREDIALILLAKSTNNNVIDILKEATIAVNYLYGVNLDEQQDIRKDSIATINPVSLYEFEGEQYIRIKTLDEDFLVGMEDLKNDDEDTDLTFLEAMEVLKKNNDRTFSLNQARLFVAYIDDVQAVISSTRYPLMNGDYWINYIDTADNAGYISGVNSDTPSVDYCIQKAVGHVRRVINI